MRNRFLKELTPALLFVAAIGAANLSALHFGPSASVVNAFLFIGFAFTARDWFHEASRSRRLAKMSALILSGSALSILINSGSAKIAAASAIAFAASEFLDYAVYSAMKGSSKVARINASNAVGSTADSLIFPTLAFGSFMPMIVLGHIAAKILGGALWSIPVARRTAAIAIAAAALSSPAQAQIASVGAGTLLVEGVEEEGVFELFVASPPLSGARAYAIGSISESESLAFVAAVDFPILDRPRLRLRAGAGANFLEFRDFEPEPIVSITSIVPVRGRVSIVSLLSSEPRNDFSLSAVVKLDVNLLFRK